MVWIQYSTLHGVDSVLYSVWSELSVVLCMVQTQMFYSVWSRLSVLHSVFYSVWSRLSVLHSVFYSVWSRLKYSTLCGPDSSVLLCMVQTQMFYSVWSRLKYSILYGPGSNVLFCMVQTQCSALSVLLCMVQTQCSVLSVLLCKVQTQMFYSVRSRLKCSTLYGPDSSVLLCKVQTQMFHSVWSRLKCSILHGPDSSVLLCKVQTQVFYSVRSRLKCSTLHGVDLAFYSSCTKLLCICVLLVEHIKDPWAVGNWQIEQELFCSCPGKTDRYSPLHHMTSVSEHPVHTLVDRATLLWEHALLTQLSPRD